MTGCGHSMRLFFAILITIISGSYSAIVLSCESRQTLNRDQVNALIQHPEGRALDLSIVNAELIYFDTMASPRDCDLASHPVLRRAIPRPRIEMVAFSTPRFLSRSICIANEYHYEGNYEEGEKVGLNYVGSVAVASTKACQFNSLTDVSKLVKVQAGLSDGTAALLIKRAGSLKEALNPVIDGIDGSRLVALGVHEVPPESKQVYWMLFEGWSGIHRVSVDINLNFELHLVGMGDPGVNYKSYK